MNAYVFKLSIGRCFGMNWLERAVVIGKKTGLGFCRNRNLAKLSIGRCFCMNWIERAVFIGKKTGLGFCRNRNLACFTILYIARDGVG